MVGPVMVGPVMVGPVMVGPVMVGPVAIIGCHALMMPVTIGPDAPG